MRLAEDKIKEGILHPEKMVRDEAVLYFSRSFSRDESVMPVAIAAIERYGWAEAFTLPTCIQGLALNDDTLPWVLKELQQDDVGDEEPFVWGGRRHTLTWILSHADAALLARHQPAIVELANLDPSVLEIIQERIDLLSAKPEVCWQELEQFCVDAKDTDDIGEVDLDFAYALVEAIGRHRETYAEQVLAILREPIEDFEGNPRVWMETFAVRMAGEMRLEPAVPLIIAKLAETEEDAEWLHEQCASALQRIGGEGVIEGVAEMYRHGDVPRRMFACGVLQHVHNDLAVAKALEFLPAEEDRVLRAYLGTAIASQFTLEGLEAVRQVALDGTYDETFADLRQEVVVAATLMEVDFPEMAAWKAEVERKRRERELRLASQARRRWEESYEDEEEEGPAPPTRKVGRNDPCPCGSGKKYKKCCLKK